MKVFQINTLCGYGSTGRITVSLAKMLEQHGGKSIIAYGRGEAPSGVNAWQFGSKVSIYYHGAMTRITDRHGLYSKESTWKLIQKIKEYEPDIIHLHNIHGYYLNYEILFQFLSEYNKPVVWTLHDCWSYTGHCSHYTSVSCDRWKNGCHHCPLKKDYPGSLIIDSSQANYKKKKELFTSLNNLTLVTPSKWLKEQVEQSFFVQNANREKTTCIVIPNGIEIDKFVPMQSDLRLKYGISDKKIILGVANVWTKQKGFEDYLKLSQVLDESYRLVMVGVSDKQRALIQNKYNNIIPVGRTRTIDELIEWYSVADVLFNSSIEETMGMTTGEAICCGTPVVTYDLTAVPESVGKGCGIVVKAKDILQVKQAVEIILKEKDKYVLSCENYRSHFAEKLANDAYYTVYQNILEDKDVI